MGVNVNSLYSLLEIRTLSLSWRGREHWRRNQDSLDGSPCPTKRKSESTGKELLFKVWRMWEQKTPLPSPPEAPETFGWRAVRDRMSNYWPPQDASVFRVSGGAAAHLKGPRVPKWEENIIWCQSESKQQWGAALEWEQGWGGAGGRCLSRPSAPAPGEQSASVGC